MKILGAFFCLILLIFLNGCSTVGRVYRFEDGEKVQVCELRLNKSGALSYERGDTKVQMDSRQPTSFDRFVKPILVGAAGSAKSEVLLN